LTGRCPAAASSGRSLVGVVHEPVKVVQGVPGHAGSPDRLVIEPCMGGNRLRPAAPSQSM
jgi:hypothetical protein